MANISRRRFVALAGSAAAFGATAALSGCGNQGMKGKTLYCRSVMKGMMLGLRTGDDIGSIGTITFTSDEDWHFSGKKDLSGTYIMDGSDIVLSDSLGTSLTLRKADDGDWYTESEAEKDFQRWYLDEDSASSYYDERIAQIPSWLSGELDGTKWEHEESSERNQFVTLKFSGKKIDYVVSDELKNPTEDEGTFWLFGRPSYEGWVYTDHSGNYKLTFEENSVALNGSRRNYYGKLKTGGETVDYELVYDADDGTLKKLQLSCEDGSQADFWLEE